MLLLLSVLAACSPPETATANAGTPPATRPASRDVDVAGLKADLDGGKVPVLVDVRTPEEFAEGHVGGAKNIPVSDIQGRLTELEAFRGKPVYLICRSGGRSAAAAKILTEKGFSAVNVTGGTAAWIAAGYAVER